MSKNDKKKYTKSFLKGAIDTECTDVALEMVPYDLLGLGIEILRYDVLKDIKDTEMYDF